MTMHPVTVWLFTEGETVPLSRVLPSALAVEVVCAGHTRPAVQAGVGGAGAQDHLAVGAHERGGTLAEVACGTTAKGEAERD